MSVKAIVWSVVCLIWGTTWLVIKIGLEDLPPISFATTRFVLAVAILFVILRVQRIPLPDNARDWKLLAVTGVLQFSLNYSLIFWGEQYIASGLAAVLQATIPMFGLMLAWIVLPNEQITKQKVLAVTLGVAGVAVVFADQLRVQSAMAFYGSAAVVVSAYLAAQSSVLVKARGSSLHPAVLTFGQMACGLPPIIAYSLIVEGNPLNLNWTWRAIACVLYLTVVGTIAAFWLYYWLLGQIDSTKAMMIAVVTPLVAVLIGWLALGETLSARTVVGGVLVMAGVAMIVFRRGVRSTS